jgi:glycine betaine/proline transport system permease protein
MAQLPTALRTIMLGVNQAVMFALSMAVVAALIGGEGLGANVLTALRALRIGDAVVAGAAITFMAIAIDQVLRGIAAGQGGRRRMPGGRAVLVALLLAAAGMFAAWMKPALAAWPEALSLHPGNAATELVQAINTNFEGPLTTLRTTLIVYILKPFQLFLLALPFSVAILATTLASFLVGGARLAARCALVLLAIAVTGWWDRAMISLHLVVVAAFAAALLGVPIGLLPGLWPRSYRAVCLFTDMLLTLPSFVYLIPAVMLFSVGDVPALFAIVAFAIAPIIRYTADGMVNAPAETIEAAEMIGASAMQRLVAVRLPLALPQMILGLSQTLLMCFAMLVITALVGTRGLEEITLNDLARIKLGEGLVAGLALSGLAIVLDRLVQAGSRALARRLGLARSGAPTVQEE